MDYPAISPDVLVADLLAIFPKLASLFVEMRLGCIGCPMSRFCTLKDVSSTYELEGEAFLAETRSRVDPSIRDRRSL